MKDAALAGTGAALKPPAKAQPARHERRTQEQRSQEMRTRLLDATIVALDKYGYAGATISVIVKEAGVSRGAHLHHFESKAALIEAAADRLMRKIFRRLGDAAPFDDDPEDRLRRLVFALWERVFLTRDGKVALELLIAARTDAELARQLSVLMRRVKDMYAAAARHYFKAKPNTGFSVEEIILLTQWQLRGMMLDAPLMESPERFRAHLDRWIALMDRFIAPRQGVTAPPPRPDWWDAP
ncbi:MAG: TetR/AcrR family transcriptional regulator [Pseudomonadota bacterium]